VSTAIENVWSPVGIKLLKTEILPKVQISVKVIWLFYASAENYKRDQQRVPENQMKERVDIVNKELAGYDWPDYVHKIDTTDLTVGQTIKKVDQL